MSPNFQPRELDGGVAWVIGADDGDPKEENSIPKFKKEFRSIITSEDELDNYQTGGSADFSRENRISEQLQPKNKIPEHTIKKPKNPKKSKMPSRNRNRSNNRLDVRGTNKAATLRAQSTASRSRSPSPLPHSRSQSPAISPLPGKRKDYSRGRVIHHISAVG